MRVTLICVAALRRFQSRLISICFKPCHLFAHEKSQQMLAFLLGTCFYESVTAQAAVNQ
jgi:hypothetical protein